MSSCSIMCKMLGTKVGSTGWRTWRSGKAVAFADEMNAKVLWFQQ